MSEPPELPDPAPKEPPPIPLPTTTHTGGRAGRVLVGGLVALVGALLAVTLAGRVVHAAPFWLAAPVLLLPYLYVAAVAVAFAVWTAVPDRTLPPAVLTLVLVVAAWLWGPSWAARGTDETIGEPLRIVSWNLRRLWGGPDDGGDALACAVDTLRVADPDVVTLLEVSRNDVDALSRELGLTCVHGTYNGSTRADRGGLASCVRGPRWRLRSGAPRRFVEDVPWYYVVAEAEGAGRVVNLLAVHLPPYHAALDRGTLSNLQTTYRAQGDHAAALLRRVERFQDPTLVAGDFNSTRDTALHVDLRSTLTDVWERGGFGFGATVTAFDWLPLRIDYVYASDAFDVVQADVVDVGCSDHRPVIGEVVLR